MNRFYPRICCLIILALASSACGASSSTQDVIETVSITLTKFVLPPENTMTPSSSTEEKYDVQINTTPTITINPSNSTNITPIIEASTTENPKAHTSGPLCNDTIFIDDVTIPDGTIIAPGKEFIKTWSIKNTGTCQWTNAYEIDFAYGNKLTGAATKLNKPVDPGQTVEVSIVLIAPKDNGWYGGWWRLKSEAGNYFGDYVYISIQITEGREVATPSY